MCCRYFTSFYQLPVLWLILACFSSAQAAISSFAINGTAPQLSQVTVLKPVGSSIVLNLALDADAGNYRLIAFRNSNLSQIVAEKNPLIWPGGAGTASIRVPLLEEQNTWFLKILALTPGDTSEATASLAIPVVRDLMFEIAQAKLNNIRTSSSGVGLFTLDRFAELNYTLSGTANQFEVNVVVNGTTVNTHTRPGSGNYSVGAIPLLTNTENQIRLQVRPLDTNAAGGGQVDSNLIRVIQDEIPPVITDLSTNFQASAPPIGTPFGPTDLASFGINVGTDSPFSTIRVLNQGTGDETVRRAGANGRITISGIELPKDPSLGALGITTTTYTLRVEDEAGNFAVRQFQVERLSLEPCFNLLKMEPADGGRIKNEGAVTILGAVCDRNAPHTVVFQISTATTANSFFKEEQIRNLRGGEFFDKDVSIPINNIAPGEDATISLQAQVIVTNPTDPNQKVASQLHDLGVVTLDRKNPAAPLLLTESAILATNTPGFTLDGVTERGGRVEFSSPGNFQVEPSRAVSAITSNFRAFVNLGSAQDGDYSLTLVARDEAGNSGAGSDRFVTVRIDRKAPVVKLTTLNDSPIQAVKPVFFKPGDSIRLGVAVDEPMSRPPRMFVTQRGDFASEAGLASSDPQGLNFVYQFVVRPSTDGAKDGPAEILIVGGADPAGNPIQEHRESVAFVVDTLPPVLDRANTHPLDGSIVGKAPAPLRLVMKEHPNTVEPGSGPWPEKVSVVAKGPIELTTTADRIIPGRIEVFDPRTVDFYPDPTAMNMDGTYLFEISMQDRVGNQFVETVVLSLDLEELSPNLIVVKSPTPDGFFRKGTLPLINSRLRLSVDVDPLLTAEMNLGATRFTLMNPIRSPSSYPLSLVQTSSQVQVGTTLNRELQSDGSDDGVFVASARLVDTAGNVSDEAVWQFSYDNLLPGVMDGLTFPAPLGMQVQDLREPKQGAVVKGPLRNVSGVLFDRKTPYGYLGSGIRTDISTAAGPISTLELFLQEPFGSALPQPILTGLVKFRAEQSQSAPNYGGPPVVRMLYELNVDPLTIEPMGLTTDGSLDGIYRLELKASDMAGNQSPVSTSWFLYDTQPPFVSIDVKSEQWITSGVLQLSGLAMDVGNRPSGYTGFGSLKGMGVRTVEIRLDAVNALGSATYPALMEWTKLSLDRDPDTHGPGETFYFLAQNRFEYRGKARLSVRAWDAAGNAQMLFRDLSLEQDEIEDPVLIEPKDRFSTPGGIVRFSWKPVEEAQSYVLVIADADGNPVSYVYEAGQVQNDINMENLPTGMLSWRVFAVDGSSQGSPGANGRILYLDRGGPSVISLTTERPVIPPDAQGRILRSEVRFEAVFNESIHPDWPPVGTLEIEPKTYLNSLGQTIVESYPPLGVQLVSLQNNVWKGLLRLEPNDKGWDYNGIGHFKLRGFRDQASNPGSDFTTAMEFDFGPWFEFRIFANPVQEQEVVFVVKGLSRKGGVVEEIADTPFLRIRQFKTPGVESDVDRQEIVSLNRLGKSWFQGGYALDSGLSGTLRLEITGKDADGNQTTRYLPFEIRRLDFSEHGQASLSRVQWVLPWNTLETQPGRMALFNLVPGTPTPGTETVMVDLARYPLSSMGKVAVMACQNDCEWVEQTREESRIIIPKGLRADLRLIQDEMSPVLKAVQTEEEMLNLEEDLRLELHDAGVGIALSDIRLNLDGKGISFEYDGEILTVSRRQIRHSVAQNLSVMVSDRLSNPANLSLLVASVGPVQIQEALVVPNPVRNLKAHLRVRLSRNQASLRVQAYDVAGARVGRAYSMGLQTGLIQIPLREIFSSKPANGVYFLRVIAEDADGNRDRSTVKLAWLQ